MIKLFAILATLGVAEADVKQIRCMTTAIYHESRGEPLQGQIAVAHVIMNRVNSDRYPDDACEVVYQPNQFSYIERARPDYDSHAWKVATREAIMAYLQLTEDETNGAKHYYAHDKVTPFWADSGEVSFKVAGHTFLKGVK